MSGTSEQTRGRIGALMRTEVFRSRARRRWPAVIEEAGLPAEVGGRIGEIVRRAGLWNRESVDVARELIAHAEEAGHRGVGEREVAEGLGDARVVSRLIRRAVRRKRPVLWHARVWTVRSVGGAIGVVALLLGGILARMFIGDPEPKHNYFADLNAPHAHLGEDEKAWPLYKEAYWTISKASEAAEGPMEKRARIVVDKNAGRPADTIATYESGLRLLPSLDPAHPDYAGVIAVLEQIRPALDLVKEGATRPMVGRPYSSKQVEPEVHTHGWLGEPIPEPADPAEQGMLIGMLLPHLSPMRSFSKWLAFDARVAVGEGDGERAADSLLAIRGMAAQVEQEPFLISYLVGVAIDALALSTLDWALSEHAEVFSRDDLVRLAHETTSLHHTMPRESLRGERMMFEDLLQHTFTDNGRGDGHITNEGIRMLSAYNSLSPGSMFEDSAVVLGAVALASRAEQRRAYTELIALARADAEAGYEIYRGRGLASEAWLRENEGRFSIAPVTMLAPAYDRVLHSQNRLLVRLDTTLAAIAMELFRRDTEAWPGSLNELVPRYLPSAPGDPFDGEPLRLAFGEAGPVIYSIGPDGVDGGGVAGELLYIKGLGTPGEGEPTAGDWVLYPPSAKN